MIHLMSGFGNLVAKEVDHITEARRIAGIGFDKGLMGREDDGALVVDVFIAGDIFMFEFRRHGRLWFGFDFKQVIKAKTLKKGKIPLVGVNDAKRASFNFPEMEGHRGQRAEERRIHQVALFQIQNER